MLMVCILFCICRDNRHNVCNYKGNEKRNSTLNRIGMADIDFFGTEMDF